MRAVISAPYPVLIQPFVSREETRYYLNGFYVHPNGNNGLRVVATDGAKMGVFYDREGVWTGKRNEGMIVQLPKQALAILRDAKREEDAGHRRAGNPRHYVALGGSKHWLIINGTVKSNEAEIVRDNSDGYREVIGKFRNVLIDGTFPDYTRVVPLITKRQIVAQSFNPQYLQDFCKVLDKFDGGTIRVVSMVKGGPALVLTSRDDFFGVLMPMRTSGQQENNDFPEFFTAKPHRNTGKEVRALPSPANPQPESKPESKPEDLSGQAREGAEIITLTPKSSTKSEPVAA